MPKLCFSLIFFSFFRESDLFFFREETDQKSTQSIIYFPEMTLANLHLWLSGSSEFLGNVLTVAILNWGAFQTAENLCISQACRLLLFCKRRPTPDGVYVTASENAAAPAAALPWLPSSPRTDWQQHPCFSFQSIKCIPLLALYFLILCHYACFMTWRDVTWSRSVVSDSLQPHGL